MSEDPTPARFVTLSAIRPPVSAAPGSFVERRAAEDAKREVDGQLPLLEVDRIARDFVKSLGPRRDRERLLDLAGYLANGLHRDLVPESHRRLGAFIERHGVTLSPHSYPSWPGWSVDPFTHWEKTGRAIEDRVRYLNVFDHGHVWNRAGKQVLFTGEPYANKLRSEDLAAIVAGFAEQGIVAEVEPEGSFYFPGATILIIARRPEQDAFVRGITTFGKWLALQRGRRDPVGDLARDVARDGYLDPREELTTERLAEHLQIFDASSGALRAFKTATREFSRRAHS